MQVVSGAMGKERVHYQAPDAEQLDVEMNRFLTWFNNNELTDPLIKASIAHLWFVTIHPFDDGNGRISRAIADLQLSRADKTKDRFYSMSSQIRIECNKYYQILETTQSGSMDITPWLEWFLSCLKMAIDATDEVLSAVKLKSKVLGKLKEGSLNDRQTKIMNMLIDGFNGKLTSSKWAKIAKSSQDTATRDILDLVAKGILMKDSAGGRSTNYLVVGEKDAG